ncbi:MAG: putative metal-binding motif-containing protein [Segetibacter sp.]
MTLKKILGPKYLSFLVHSLWISFILPILLTSTVFTKYRSSFKFNQPLHAINYVNRASNQIEDSHSSIQWLDLPSKSTNTAVLKKAHVYSDIYYNFSFVNNDEEQEDNDKDGYDESTDCDDNNYCINPGVVEVCNGIDDNCNGQIDEGLTDVDEVCNGLDDNCNGEIDEGYNKRPFYPDQDRDGYGDKNSDSRSIIQACATRSVF